MPFETDTDILEEVLVDEQDTSDPARLVVYNDDYNTFDHVIKCFIKILKHSQEQAEQLSYIIHYNGKATVKTASRNELRPKRDALVDRGLSAVIEGDER
jgi:ATP-dependent Clp protease adaptor protein ClpS